MVNSRKNSLHPIPIKFSERELRKILIKARNLADSLPFDSPVKRAYHKLEDAALIILALGEGKDSKNKPKEE